MTVFDELFFSFNVFLQHCLLDVSPSAVERLHALQVYPIILFVKFKSPKHIRLVQLWTVFCEEPKCLAAFLAQELNHIDIVLALSLQK